jgi:DNA modification methylase
MSGGAIRRPWELHHGDALEVLATLPDASVDSVVTDPPYAHVKRPYGYWTEEEWFALMKPVVREVRRILKPQGSAVFIIQPNSEKIGRLRPWVFDFVSWCCREWNVVRDAYWWNYTAIPSAGCDRENGLLRPSIKLCVWVGEPDCYRNQDAILWSESEHNAAQRATTRAAQREPCPSGYRRDRFKMASTALERGGVVPFNVFPIPNCHGNGSHSGNGHEAATPLLLCRKWVRYLTPPGGVALDPFCGAGATGEAAILDGFRFIGIDRHAPYLASARERLERAARQSVLVME